MSPRLRAELQRLYLTGPLPDKDPAPNDSGGPPGPNDPNDPNAPNAPLGPRVLGADAQGRVRALVLAVRGTASWPGLSAVWQGVQADLGWPAPAIVVNGHDALQLWFSLAEPLPASDAVLVLAALRRRYLADLPAHRLPRWPHPDAAPNMPDPPSAGAAIALPPLPPSPALPAQACREGQWSAVVAPDLAPLFEDTPWLDLPPGDDAQAGLLAPLRCTSPAQLAQVLDPAAPSAHGLSQPAPAADTAATGTHADVHAHDDGGTGTGAQTCTEAASARAEARRFLLGVVHDGAAPLALRIEAAKALLPH